jgi:hypothetical protein
MISKKTILITIFLVFFTQFAKAITWKTVAAGNWNVGGIWQGGIAPPLSNSDTFLIRHNLIISNNLYFNSNALLQIDSTGGICGHYTMTVNLDAKVVKYGTLDLDTINIPGGLVNFYSPGSVIITQYGVLSNGGQLNTNGCSVIVGPWFNCQFRDDSGIEVFEKSTFNLYPNPNNGTFTIETNPSVKLIAQIHDIDGKIILNQIINGKAIIDARSLSDGIYNVSAINNERVINKRMVITR